VLENQGNPITNHLFQASTAGVHDSPGINLEISKKALLILEAASCTIVPSISITGS